MQPPVTARSPAIYPVLRKLGCLPPKSDPRALMYGRFATAPPTLPKATNFWRKREPFPIRTFGNNQYNDCTIAKQAIAALRMERLEANRTPQISDEEVVRVYKALVDRKYGGADGGAFETDALDNWRRPELSFRDSRGHPLTIDAYTRLNPADQQEIRQAIWTSGSHGIAVCVNLPRAFQGLHHPHAWDIPTSQSPIGDWLPGSWGGHSMWARDYDENGIWLVHTWDEFDQLLTWRAAAIYLCEAHLVIDSIDYWRKKKPRAAKHLDLEGIREAVNQVSSHKIPPMTERGRNRREPT